MNEDFTVTISGIKFRACSASSLAWLVKVRSPLVFGGNFEPEDFVIFAWMHAAPIAEVEENIKAGTYEHAAILWGHTAPPEIFAVYSAKKMQAFADDLSKSFADEKTGFIPFPRPSHSKKPWNVRAFLSTILRSWIGFRRPFIKSTRKEENPFP